MSMLPYLATIALLTVMASGPWRNRLTHPPVLASRSVRQPETPIEQCQAATRGDEKMLCNMNRRRFLQATAATGLVASQGIVSAWAAEPLKIGFVYVGPIGDYGWTHGHDLGRKAVEAHFGNKVKTTYVESVAEGPDAERVIRQLAQQGHGLIFTTSFGYMEQTLRVAKQFPKLKFEHATGYDRRKYERV